MSWGDLFPELALTPAFLGSPQGRAFPVAGEEAPAAPAPGNRAFALRPQLSEQALRYPQTQGVLVTDLADQQAKVEQAIRPQAEVLGLFAALAGLVALAVVGQMLGRQLIIDSSEYPILSAQPGFAAGTSPSSRCWDSATAGVGNRRVAVHRARRRGATRWPASGRGGRALGPGLVCPVRE